ncbi:MAG: DHHA1 domain-containing protein, partial [Patescibacteria group bacterium]
GLRLLLQFAGMTSKNLDTYTLGFIIAPRINAAGRIEHASSAFDLLIANEYSEAEEAAKNLEALNTKRQKITEVVISEAREQLLLVSERKILLASGANWPKGVVGLVAGKLTEEFGKPVLVMERGQTESTGSARSVANFNIVEALKFSSEHLVKFGGHAAAAGFTVKTEHIGVFYKNLLDFADQNLNTEDLSKEIEIEAELKAEDVNLKNAEMLEAFEPFGVDNPKPKLLLSDLVIKDQKLVGKEQKHLQLSLVSETGKLLKAIAFGFGKSAPDLLPGQKIDIVFEMIKDEWNGLSNVKLRIIDYKKRI